MFAISREAVRERSVMTELRNVTKIYGATTREQVIFRDVNLCLNTGSMLALRGRSGAGKSTLLRILAGLDCNYEGEYYYQGRLLPKQESAAARFRLREVGIITQEQDLLADYDVFQNVALQLKLLRYRGEFIKSKVTACLEKLGILHLQCKYPAELSGGEKQLVAIARAIIHEPHLILADEPTGALDLEAEQRVLQTLAALVNKDNLLLIATHSDAVTAFCGHKIWIENHSLHKNFGN